MQNVHLLHAKTALRGLNAFSLIAEHGYHISPPLAGSDHASSEYQVFGLKLWSSASLRIAPETVIAGAGSFGNTLVA